MPIFSSNQINNIMKKLIKYNVKVAISHGKHSFFPGEQLYIEEVIGNNPVKTSSIYGSQHEFICYIDYTSLNSAIDKGYIKKVKEHDTIQVRS